MSSVSPSVPRPGAVRIGRLFPAWLALPGVASPWAWLLTPLCIGLASRFIVVLVGYVSLWLLPDNPGFVRAWYGDLATLQNWYTWDASWYTAIAFRGYAASGPDAPSVAFWPLLPLLEAALGRGILPRLDPSDPLAESVGWAGLVVVFLAFLVALALLYRLLLADHSPDVARRAVTLLAFAPGALFYTAPYPEALLLAGVAGCLLALRHGHWAWAGLAGGIAAVAQAPGCLLVLPFVWTYLERERRPGWSLLWGLLIPLGPALWLAYLGATVGDPLAPINAAGRFWQHAPAWPWETLWRAADLTADAPTQYILVALNLVSALAALIAATWALARGPRAWGAWGLALLILYLSVPPSQPLDGLLRYTLPVIPIWLGLARLARFPLAEGLLIGLFAAFQGLLTALFVNGYWVA